MRNSRNFLCYTLIGLEAKVIKSASRSLEGISGRIIDESKNTITLETKKGPKIIPKNSCVFRFFFEEDNVDVDGSTILFRPLERPKKLKRCVHG